MENKEPVVNTPKNHHSPTAAGTIYGNENSSSMYEAIKELRSKAYKIVWENSDYKKINKIISGIESGEITKANLFDEVRKLTKNVTSSHSIGRWQSITEWFNEAEWFLEENILSDKEMRIEGVFYFPMLRGETEEQAKLRFWKLTYEAGIIVNDDCCSYQVQE